MIRLVLTSSSTAAFGFEQVKISGPALEARPTSVNLARLLRHAVPVIESSSPLRLSIL